MANAKTLTGIAEKGYFRQIEKAFGKHFHLPLETIAANAAQFDGMCSPDCHPEFCRLIRSSRAGFARCRQDRLRSLSMAFETGQPYISFCHAGIALVCVPVMDEDKPLAGIFFGKCLSEPLSDIIENDIIRRLRGLRLDFDKILLAAGSLPILSARKIHEASEFLFIVVYEVTGLDPRVVRWRRDKDRQQGQISELIQQRKKQSLEYKYPYQSERELTEKVTIGDKTGASQMLNFILASAMLASPGQLDALKARLVELLGILSRSAVEGGVDVNLILEKNRDYITKVISLDTQEEISAWISRALDDFIDSVRLANRSKKVSQLKPAIGFIEANYPQQIRLSDVAKASHLSVSRLAHLFKERMGISVIDYVNTVRIGHAKRLLITTDNTCTTICFDVGFNNQGYFARTFKKLTGSTPGQFRKSSAPS